MLPLTNTMTNQDRTNPGHTLLNTIAIIMAPNVYNTKKSNSWFLTTGDPPPPTHTHPHTGGGDYLNAG
jgi:hypothetical protein